MKQPVHLAAEDLRQLDANHVPGSLLGAHDKTIKEQLRGLGADLYDMRLPEVKVLPLIIHPGERIEGVVFGKYKYHAPEGRPVSGHGILMATDSRILLIDHKPFYLNCKEISYEVLSAVGYGKVGLIGTVSLYSRVTDITVRTYNKACAHSFVEAIEKRIMAGEERSYDYGMRKEPE